MPPCRLDANPNEIHIWRVDATESNAALLQSSLTEEEQAHAGCFRLPASRNEFIVGRGFMRAVAGCYLGLAPEYIQFRLGHHGKPELANDAYRAKCRFNLSHSRGLILAAFTVGHEVGIDVEFLDPAICFGEIADMVFSRLENKWLSELPYRQRRLSYFRCWTRKEAFLKALGKGLSDRIRTIEILPAAEAFVARIDGVPVEEHWMIKDLDVGDIFVAAVAVANRSCRFRLWDWSVGPGR